MADVERSLAALQALFADNTAGDISEQDLRDFLVSCFGGYGGLYIDPAAASQGINIALAKLIGWTGAMSASGTTPSIASNDITVANAAKYLVEFTGSLTAPAGQTITFQVAKNAAALTGGKHTVSGGSPLATPRISCVVDCAASDVLSILIGSSSNGQTITMSTAQFTVKRIG